jgi:hypothetical protein
LDQGSVAREKRFHSLLIGCHPYESIPLALI